MGVFGGVVEVSGVGCGKVVASREVFFGAHVEVVVAGEVEHGFDAGHRGQTDGAGGQARVFVGVVGAVCFEVLVENAPNGEVVERKLHGGVGLKRHASVQAVEIHPCHHRLFGIVGRFLLDDGGQGDDFVGGQPRCLGFAQAMVGPEGLRFFLHSGEEPFGGERPVYFVGVGDEEAEGRCGCLVVFLQQGGVRQGLFKLVGGGLEMLAEKASKVVRGAQHGDGEPNGSLRAVAQASEDGERRLPASDVVTPLVQVFRIVPYRCQCPESTVGEKASLSG